MSAPAPAKPADLVTVNIDGKEIAVPKGTNVIEAAKLVGVEIPHYCYHPKLSIVGNCRMCLIEMGMPAVDPATKAPVMTPPRASRGSTGSRARRSAAAPTPRPASTSARTRRW
ncbi:MAG: 2Fe-2S iron-sulfur cluster-binding protein [Lacunisphaera sp.]